MFIDICTDIDKKRTQISTSLQWGLNCTLSPEVFWAPMAWKVNSLTTWVILFWQRRFFLSGGIVQKFLFAQDVKYLILKIFFLELNLCLELFTIFLSLIDFVPKPKWDPGSCLMEEEAVPGNCLLLREVLIPHQLASWTWWRSFVPASAHLWPSYFTTLTFSFLNSKWG